MNKKYGFKNIVFALILGIILDFILHFINWDFDIEFYDGIILRVFFLVGVVIWIIEILDTDQ